MIKTFEKELEKLYSDKNTAVSKSMNYSLLAGGKRVRPLMLLSLLSDLSGSYEEGLSAACALEMVHTYSLVHDDLPAMDNDDFRRHKSTNHKVFGEGLAILAGDGLLNDSFGLIAQSKLSAEVKVSCIEILSRNAGSEGMILGQEIDIENQFDNLEQLAHSYRLKTGCLFSCAFEMASVIALRPDLQVELSACALDLGVYFQYQDDILEYTSDFEKMGKHIDSDAQRNKHTIVTFEGLEKAQETANALYEDIIKRLSGLTHEDSTIIKVIKDMSVRTF